MTAISKSSLWKLFLLLFLWAVVFSPIIPPLIEAWLSHSDNSYAFLVPFVSFYFLLEKRSEVGSIPVKGSVIGLIFLAVCLLAYLVSYIGGIVFFSRIMLVASLITVLWSCLGTPITRCLAFPLGFLFFIVPVPITLLGMVSFPLQLIATKISAALIQYLTIPVYREGNILYFIHTQLEVAEACSGIRSIMSLTMISTIFAYITTGSTWSKVVLVLAAVPVAMIANILRVTGTGILAHFFGDQVARGFLHDFSGLVVFLFGLIILFASYVALRQIGK
jgi:exosortase